ncbi:S-adenosyl-L-methionine-dependent methyltransferase [Phyllosticta citricarpa]|uniref:S-adenosyl-L-methionine-dependent methyltransferase n=1 Tax=Phyllosticta citricarpa TaxID=55181 RepID=A0ABR1LMU1_9PEZI
MAHPHPPVKPASSNKVYLLGHSRAVVDAHSRRTAQSCAAHLLPHLKPTHKVLDVGCGPGSITTTLAPFVPEGHVTGVDYSPEVIALAERLAAAVPSGVTNVSFQTADAFALPFADGTFDVVHAHQVVQHVADPVGLLCEMRRVAKPDGGIVAVREGDAHIWFPDESEQGPGRSLGEWFALWMRMARDQRTEPMTGRRLKRLGMRAGFASQDIIVQAGSIFFEKESLVQWCETWARRLTESEFSTRALDGKYTTREELESMAKAWREFAQLDDAWYNNTQGEAIFFRRD